MRWQTAVARVKEAKEALVSVQVQLHIWPVWLVQTQQWVFSECVVTGQMGEYDIVYMKFTWDLNKYHFTLISQHKPLCFPWASYIAYSTLQVCTNKNDQTDLLSINHSSWFITIDLCGTRNYTHKKAEVQL